METKLERLCGFMHANRDVYQAYSNVCGTRLNNRRSDNKPVFIRESTLTRIVSKKQEARIEKAGRSLQSRGYDRIN